MSVASASAPSHSAPASLSSRRSGSASCPRSASSDSRTAMSIRPSTHARRNAAALGYPLAESSRSPSATASRPVFEPRERGCGHERVEWPGPPDGVGRPFDAVANVSVSTHRTPPAESVRSGSAPGRRSRAPRRAGRSGGRSRSRWQQRTCRGTRRQDGVSYPRLKSWGWVAPHRTVRSASGRRLRRRLPSRSPVGHVQPYRRYSY